MSQSHTEREYSRSDTAAWIIAALSLVLLLKLHLLAALLAGMLVYDLAHALVGVIQSRSISRAYAQILAIMVLAAIISGLIALGVTGIVSFLRSGGESIPALLKKMAEILESSKAILPDWTRPYLPSDADSMRAALVQWLRENAGTLRLAGKQAGTEAAHVLIGMVIGALLSLVQSDIPSDRRPLARSLVERANRLHLSFRRVVLAQGSISLLNTFFTWVYLGVALPLLGIDLPFIKTMLAVTFIAGLLPVVGNLISNTVIVIVSLSYAPYVAAASLIFLIAIHKLEYFLNANIIGYRINAAAWELLMAMLVMESAFGLAGLVAAPLYYAYLKDELTARKLV